MTKEKIDEYYWAYAQLRVKQSFFNFFLMTINNYLGYFKNPQKKDHEYLASNDLFDFDGYIA